MALAEWGAAMRPRLAVLVAALIAVTAGAGLNLAREATDHAEVSTDKLIEQALAGEDGKEVVAQTYVFQPGTVLPWHIHPDAHEIAYIVEGTLTFERAGGAPVEIEAGNADYLPPNVVHRGMNKGDVPVKLFVVRIKPKDKPLVEEVPPPQ
jgi:quercetin dioxygenase-like cupin family protein